ncbi:MAG: phytanoyl-CoA dioxygenase family protein [Chthoniobacteraceae bacterium]
MILRPNTAESLEALGYRIIPNAIPAGTLEELTQSVESLTEGDAGKCVAGARQLAARVPTVARVASSQSTAKILRSLGSPGAFLVRSIFFDKQPGANWKAAWHQDLTIAVLERRETPGFGPWSQKAGMSHVQPPAAVIEGMITLRLHLDDCDADNGALRVLPGSHRGGILSAEQIQCWRKKEPEAICAVAKGGILAMRPLLLHASSPALRPRHRRVIHLEFAMDELPGGLEWLRN